jgi:hypothetical protein
MTQNSANSAQPPKEIYKEEEFALMCDFIRKGLFKDVNLATACHVDRDTIASWKKRKEAIQAHREALAKYLPRRKDEEKILAELGVETDPDKLEVKAELKVTGLEFLNKQS